MQATFTKSESMKSLLFFLLSASPFLLVPETDLQIIGPDPATTSINDDDSPARPGEAVPPRLENKGEAENCRSCEGNTVSLNREIKGAATENFVYSTSCDQVKITMTRKGGKAAGRVKIFVNKKLKKTMTFKRGVGEESDSIIFIKVRGSYFKIQMENLSKDKDVRFHGKIEQS